MDDVATKDKWYQYNTDFIPLAQDKRLADHLKDISVFAPEE